MACKYKDSCVYEICMMEDCCDFEEGVMTNGDRIREMSDEELAKQLVVTLTGGPITMYLALNNGTSYLSKKFATEKVLEWLQQPAEASE